MKTKLFSSVACLALLGLVGTAQASLVVDGTVLYGGESRQLIYDTDLNITWLDYNNFGYVWDNQRDWAAGLSFEVNGTTYDNWRLPATVDGHFEYGYDGTTTGGYNITTSELGHLFFLDLNNNGRKNIDGSDVESENVGLINQGLFTSLSNNQYWSGTEYSELSNVAWILDFSQGYQDITGTYSNEPSYGIAVHQGRLSAVPIPGAIWLLGSGLVGLLGVRSRKWMPARVNY
jgi:hypothetical protein